jgi:uncharacterized protein YjdB
VTAIFTSISIVPVLPYLDPVYVASGDTALLTALGHYGGGSTQDLTPIVTWSSNDTLRANVDSQGQVTAGQPGTASITARYGALSDAIPVNVGPAELRSIDVSPTNPSVSLDSGSSVQFQAVGHFSDQSSKDLTCDPANAWSSASPSIADFVSGCGLATPAAPGTTTITATTAADVIDPLGLLSQVDVSGSTSLTVQP